MELAETVYGNKYFWINKVSLEMAGLWPYQSYLKKIIRRTLLLAVLFAGLFPHINGMIIWCGEDLALCCENFGSICFLCVISFEFIAMFICENEMSFLYEKLAKTLCSIEDLNEKNIIERFANSGRIKTIIFAGGVLSASAGFALSSLIPIFLDIIIPLNQSRPKNIPVKSEPFVNPEECFYEIYLFYNTIALVTCLVIIPVCTTYTVIVEQTLGLLSVVQFIDLIDINYRSVFLADVAPCVLFFTVVALLVVESVHSPVNFLRYSVVETGMILGGFYMTIPGQMVEDETHNLFISTYMNDWYLLPENSKTLLKILRLRCMKTVHLTIGGLFHLNFKTFGQLLKTSVSYMAVLISFRD